MSWKATAVVSRWLFPFGVVGSLVGLASPGHAGMLDASWTAPTANIDGSPLTDLTSYRVYYGTGNSPCPGSSFVEVASQTTSPSWNSTASTRLTGLSTGTLYYVAVTAVDASGTESSCLGPASAAAHADFAVSPTGTTSFGSVNIGSFVDRTFTVQNTAGGTLSGSASTSGQFSIVSGSPFSIVGVGASQPVTVRFSPTAALTSTANVNFTANGETISRIVTGSSSATDSVAPTVAITSPTTASTYTAATASISFGGTAADNVGVTQVTWTNSAGGSGTASGTTAWSATVSLQSGSNVLTATARDAAGNTVSASLTVTYIPSPPPPGSIAVSPASVALTTVAGQVPASQAVTVTVPNGGLFSTYDSATFYDSSTCYSGTGKSCPSGTVVPIVPITGNVQSLPPGTYSAPLTVSSSGYADVLVPVVLTVTATPPPPPPTDTTPPSDIQVTAVSKSNGMLTLSGTARDNVGVSKVTWTSNRGGSGMASGSATWSFTVPLKPGQTTFSITAWDAAGNNRTETITVKR